MSLVGLLVVIAIIGILIALLLPAVQAAREAARRSQCSNNLKQLGFGMLRVEHVYGHFPSGGWGWRWVGEPERGPGTEQPGGWAFSILPYLEQQQLFEMGSNEQTATDFNMQCYLAGRTDYAACLGGNMPSYYNGPNTLADGDNPSFAWPAAALANNGICYLRSEVRMRDVSDGSIHTMMLAEKYVMVDGYDTQADGADNENLYVGWDNDNWRTTHPDALGPLRDRAGYQVQYAFGGAHPAGINAVFCDGSVHGVSYDVDRTAFQLLGSRADGQVVESEF